MIKNEFVHANVIHVALAFQMLKRFVSKNVMAELSGIYVFGISDMKFYDLKIS